MLASNFIRYIDLLPMFNVYQIPEKEHQVVDGWAVDEISVSEILFGKCSEYMSQVLRN